MLDKMNRWHRALAVAGALCISGPSAHAQMWIGLMVGQMMAQGQAAAQERACMGGAAMVDAEVREATDAAPKAMDSYWSAVNSGAPALASFHDGSKTAWVHGPTQLGLKALSTIADPFAATGRTLSAAGLVRAGDGQSAQGQWLVAGPDGKRLGTYDVLFRRTAGNWLISRIELVDAATWVDPVVQYCHAPGDVLPWRVSDGAAGLQYAQKRAAKAETRAARARVEAEKAHAGGRTDAISRADQAQANSTADLDARQRELREAERVDGDARKDMAAFEAMRAAGKASLAM